MGGGKPQQKVDLKEVKEKQALARSQMLRGAFGFLTEGAFRQRKAYFTAKVGLHYHPCCHACLQTKAQKEEFKLPKAAKPLLTFKCLQNTGILNQKSEQKSAQEQMMTNPDLMSGMMKQNLSGIVPQVH